MIFFHLKNCLFPSISRRRPVRFPRCIFFLRAFRFRPKTARFPCPFSNENQHSAQSLPLVFVRSSSPPRQCAQNFLCILYKTAENPPVIFYRCTALKSRIFPCAGAAKRLPFACKEEPQANSHCFADFECKADFPQPFKDSRCQARCPVTGSP